MSLSHEDSTNPQINHDDSTNPLESDKRKIDHLADDMASKAGKNPEPQRIADQQAMQALVPAVVESSASRPLRGQALPTGRA